MSLKKITRYKNEKEHQELKLKCSVSTLICGNGVRLFFKDLICSVQLFYSENRFHPFLSVKGKAKGFQGPYSLTHESRHVGVLKVWQWQCKAIKMPYKKLIVCRALVIDVKIQNSNHFEKKKKKSKYIYFISTKKKFASTKMKMYNKCKTWSVIKFFEKNTFIIFIN